MHPQSTQTVQSAAQVLDLLRDLQTFLGPRRPDDPDERRTWDRIDAACQFLTKPAPAPVPGGDLRDRFELAYATEWHANGGRNNPTIAELTEVIKTWRNGDTYDDDLLRLKFGWDGFQWHAVATARRVQLAAERKGRIYVAGPMTGYVDHNFPAFNAAAERLRAEGWHVENPADHGEVPGAEWADYMHVDVAMLASCGAIYLLPGWSKSRGGSVEAQLAHSLGMEFHYAEGAERAELSVAVVSIETIESWLSYACGLWNLIEYDRGPTPGGLEGSIERGYDQEIAQMRQVLKHAGLHAAAACAREGAEC